MGDLQVGETFRDRWFLIETATGNPHLLQTPSIIVIDESGNRAVAANATEEGNGWYYYDFAPDAAGTWSTEASNAGSTFVNNYIHSFKVGGGEVTDIKAETALILADTNAILVDTGTTLDNLVDDLEARVTALRAGYLDELDFDLDARLGAPAGASMSADIADVEGKVDGIEARTNNRLQTDTFFSPYQALVTLDTSHTDAALPTVTIPNWTGTIVHVYAGIKWDWVDNSNAAANKLSGAQEIQINKAGGAWTDAIHFVDDMFSLPASTLRAGGGMAMGYTDLVGTIDVFNTTAQFQWDEPLTDQDSILLYNVQTFVIIKHY